MCYDFYCLPLPWLPSTALGGISLLRSWFFPGTGCLSALATGRQKVRSEDGILPVYHVEFKQYSDYALLDLIRVEEEEFNFSVPGKIHLYSFILLLTSLRSCSVKIFLLCSLHIDDDILTHKLGLFLIARQHFSVV